jgi:two-component sensor histidine kinase
MDDLQPHLLYGATAVARRSHDWESRELNHRLANSLQLAVDLLGFQQQRAEDPTARAALEEAMARLAAVGQLHHYLSVRDPQAPVELAGFLRGLCSVVGLSTGLTCELTAQTVSVSGHMAQHIGLLINECAINARKHAYGVKGGVLHIESTLSPGLLKLVVSDDGRGLRSTPADGQGLGMSIIHAIVRELGGTFSASSKNGACFSFLIPLASAAPAAASSRSFANWNGEI